VALSSAHTPTPSAERGHQDARRALHREVSRGSQPAHHTPVDSLTLGPACSLRWATASECRHRLPQAAHSEPSLSSATGAEVRYSLS